MQKKEATSTGQLTYIIALPLVIRTFDLIGGGGHAEEGSNLYRVINLYNCSPSCY